jgi:hypothetical protein
MLYRLLVIVPSRGRPAGLARMIDALRVTRAKDTTVAVGLDDDDVYLPVYMDAAGGADVTYTVGPRKSLAGWTNVLALAALDKGFTHFASFGDDHLPRTVGWDQKLMMSVSKTGGPGIAYGDDLAMGKRLATAPVISVEIVRALGWMCLPALGHYCVDNVWSDLGHAAGCLVYNPDVIVEHLHHTTGKASMDATYGDAGGFHTDHRDYRAYLEWQAHRMAADVATVKALR